jgi:hypothetical protein
MVGTGKGISPGINVGMVMMYRLVRRFNQQLEAQLWWDNDLPMYLAGIRMEALREVLIPLDNWWVQLGLRNYWWAVMAELERM